MIGQLLMVICPSGCTNGGAIMKDYGVGCITIITFFTWLKEWVFHPHNQNLKKHTKDYALKEKDCHTEATVVPIPRDSPLPPTASHLVANNF